MPGSASGPPSGRTSAGLLPGRVNHVDHASLNSHVLRRENQLLVVSVLRPEPQLPVLPVDPLHRHLLPAPEERHDHRPFRRCLVLLDDEEIPILYPRPHHALPYHPQEVAPPPGTRREQLGGQRVSLVRRHGLEPPPRSLPPLSVSQIIFARPTSRTTYPSSSSFLRWWRADCELLNPAAAATSRTLGGGSPAPARSARWRRILSRRGPNVSAIHTLA